MPLNFENISVRLEGLTPAMFDRYPGDNDTVLRPEEKMYFGSDGKTLVLPSANIYSFLVGENTKSATKTIYGKAWGKVAAAIRAYVVAPEPRVPLLRDGEPIKFHGFENGRDDKARMYIDYSTARVKGGVPNPKVRPVLELPWAVEFSLKLFENQELSPGKLRDIFEQGGVKIGLFTWRGFYGKFSVENWEVTPAQS